MKGAHSLGINDSGITEYQERWSQGTSNPSLNHSGIELDFFSLIHREQCCGVKYEQRFLISFTAIITVSQPLPNSMT